MLNKSTSILILCCITNKHIEEIRKHKINQEESFRGYFALSWLIIHFLNIFVIIHHSKLNFSTRCVNYAAQRFSLTKGISYLIIFQCRSHLKTLEKLENLFNTYTVAWNEDLLIQDGECRLYFFFTMYIEYTFKWLLILQWTEKHIKNQL